VLNILFSGRRPLAAAAFPLLLVLVPAPVTAAAAGADDDYGEVSDFTLTDRGGKTVTREDLLGKVWVASFVMVVCPDGRCPAVTQTVRRLQDETAKKHNLLFVTFTVDPDHDDPKVLNRYAELNGADPDRWLFLTGKAETIDALLRSFYLRGGEKRKGQKDHSQKLVLVDQRGHIRGYYDGLLERYAPKEDFESGLSKLKKKAELLQRPELPAWMPKDFPAFNAALNGAAAVLILLGYAAVRRGLVRLHAASMLTAVAVSAVFLASYLFYHLVVKQGQPTYFSEQVPNAPNWVGGVYLGILGTHTILAMAAAPLVLVTVFLALRGSISRHRKLAWWTLPIWLYVSVTGVVVYWMLYQLPALYPVVRGG
jgi:protein SCO1/2/putative membrane protein